MALQAAPGDDDTASRPPSAHLRCAMHAHFSPHPTASNGLQTCAQPSRAHTASSPLREPATHGTPTRLNPHGIRDSGGYGTH
eukprot:CAMPEP_0202774430 /NCGR_PEP_ID=MMETSP1388-20130828/46428_1 /ASSEMBLY_ACC=CAM_ASM_000864 /TAXON_ID=37098 /ORGANISM="Isochrysis sp, Strain CCMP1244" /LENGTH=81 /DNA_ID=CAMNT_0049443489 /DNA_START=29 /DNA_END=271 /DNA_ORIENTATION=-